MEFLLSDGVRLQQFKYCFIRTLPLCTGCQFVVEYLNGLAPHFISEPVLSQEASSVRQLRSFG